MPYHKLFSSKTSRNFQHSTVLKPHVLFRILVTNKDCFSQKVLEQNFLMQKLLWAKIFRSKIYYMKRKWTDIPYTSKFLWHNIFVNFTTRHPITKVFSQKFRMVRSERGFSSRDHKIFIPKINIRTITKFFRAKINICVILKLFKKFLDHENLEVYGTHLSDILFVEGLG